jgi:hypothetical protein
VDSNVATKANPQEVTSVGKPIPKTASSVVDLVGESGMADFTHRFLF